MSAFTNWQLVMGPLAEHARVLAPDLAGFGYSEIPSGLTFSREVWLRQIVDFLDAVGVDRVSVVGNSFGGSMALALAIHHPERGDKADPDGQRRRPLRHHRRPGRRLGL